jgi:hypothetical protein
VKGSDTALKENGKTYREGKFYFRLAVYEVGRKDRPISLTRPRRILRFGCFARL